MRTVKIVGLALVLGATTTAFAFAQSSAGGPGSGAVAASSLTTASNWRQRKTWRGTKRRRPYRARWVSYSTGYYSGPVIILGVRN